MTPRPSSLHLGVASMVVYSLGTTLLLVLSKVMDDSGWPIWHISAVANLSCLPIFILISVVSRAVLPKLTQVKWVACRACCVVVSFVCTMVAVRLTGAPGDINALTSINVVAASAIGHLFLNERLRWMHTFAVACSLTGATLISKPAFLFNVSSDDGASMFAGYMFALVAGFLRAIALASARKSGDVSVPFQSVSACSTAAIIFMIVPFTPLARQQSVTIVHTDPWGAVAWVAANALLMLLSSAGGSLGSMLCPAAVSATVFTGSGIVFGYAAQVLLFKDLPDLLSVVGALLMMVAVVVMAVFRLKHFTAEPVSGVELDLVVPTGDGSLSKPSPETDMSGAASDTSSSHAAQSPMDAEAETESLFSFMAAEFAEFEAHAETIRQRRHGGRISEPVPHAQRIGVAPAVSPAVAHAIGAAITMSVAFAASEASV